MAANEGYFERLQRMTSAARSEQGTTTIAPRPVATNYACPKCKAVNKPGVRLMSIPGKHALVCPNAHEYPDTLDLLQMNPDILEAAPPPPRVPQVGECRYEVIIPEELRNVVEAKYGKRLVPSLAAILAVMVEPDAFMVSQKDVVRLMEKFNVKIRDANRLIGEVENVIKERDQLKLDLSLLKPAPGVQTGYVPIPGATNLLLQFDEQTMMTLRDKAKFNGMTVEKMLQENIPMFLQNGWF